MKQLKQLDENIIKTEYSEIMQKSYIDYAMSVIISRALPDVRDGLKPVQRRTLYDMHELGIRHDRPYRKSARIVGDTMGKYHPHGDSSIYDALVVMTQEFKKGLPLIDGHGNFGNIEGDGAAAMRYTEARLKKVTQDGLLSDLDKDIVDFVPNFDETEKEPSVLPARFPNLLVNGAEGIAVGMVTNIPPHNLGEIIDATIAFMEDDRISTQELMKYVKGPDFPTGGIVVNRDDLLSIYETGMGKIKVRGKVEIEKGKNGKTNVVISEIPYPMIGANISKFLSDVANLAETKKTTDILDISNQSSKEGIRIVIELRKDADVTNFIHMLYHKTRLEDTFSVNMLAISKGRPETLGLKEIIRSNVEFQLQLASRKYTYLLEKEKEKREVQEGLIKACNVIDLIIEILRGSKDRTMAKKCLTLGETAGIRFRSKESGIMAESLMFTERQADAILEMRLYKLIGLEIEALVKSHEETVRNIYFYEEILGKRDSMLQLLIREMNLLKKEYARKRRTVIEQCEEAVYEEKKIEETDLVFLMDRFGYVKTIDPVVFERNKEAALQENKYILSCKNTGKICIFSDRGQLHTIKVMDIPYGKFRDKGVPIDNISNFTSSKEEILLAAEQKELQNSSLIFVTKGSMMKVVEGSEFDVNKRTVSATKLMDQDVLAGIILKDRETDIVLQSKNGYFLRFPLSEIPIKKKAAIGVRGMKLEKEDRIEKIYCLEAGKENKISYKEKELNLHLLKLGKRDTKGIKTRK